jgi:hypothetical protein
MVGNNVYPLVAPMVGVLHNFSSSFALRSGIGGTTAFGKSFLLLLALLEIRISYKCQGNIGWGAG